MNLFRKQKFSIRKFNIGIFSALIATVAFLAHPGKQQHQNWNLLKIMTLQLNLMEG